MSPHPRRLCRAAAFVAALVLVPSAAQAQDPTIERARRAVEGGQAASVRGELVTYAKANPRSHAAAFWLGRALLAEGKHEDAADWLGKAAELDPKSAPTQFYLGAAIAEEAERASKLRQPFLAKKVQHAFERAVQLDPEYLDAREGLLRFYMVAPGVMGGSMDKARQQAAEIRRRSALRGAYAFASIARAEKKPDVAAREYEAAIAAAPDSAGPYVALIGVHVDGRQWAEAATVLARWRARRPQDPRVTYTTGRLAAVSGQRLDEGEAALRRYLEHVPSATEPSLAAAHWRLGQVLEHRGDRAAARREYETAVRMDPKLTAAKESLRKLGG